MTSEQTERLIAALEENTAAQLKAAAATVPELAYISWAEALRRIGGNQEDAETALRAAVAAGKVKVYTVLKSRRERVWSPDLAHVGAVQRQQTEKPRRKSRKSGYRIDRR
jgi:hypothetical protein